MWKYFESKGEEKEKTKIRDKLKEYEIKEKLYIYYLFSKQYIFDNLFIILIRNYIPIMVLNYYCYTIFNIFIIQNKSGHIGTKIIIIKNYNITIFFI